MMRRLPSSSKHSLHFSSQSVSEISTANAFILIDRLADLCHIAKHGALPKATPIAVSANIDSLFITS